MRSLSFFVGILFLKCCNSANSNPTALSTIMIGIDIQSRVHNNNPVIFSSLLNDAVQTGYLIRNQLFNSSCITDLFLCYTEGSLSFEMKQLLMKIVIETKIPFFVAMEDHCALHQPTLHKYDAIVSLDLDLEKHQIISSSKTFSKSFFAVSIPAVNALYRLSALIDPFDHVVEASKRFDIFNFIEGHANIVVDNQNVNENPQNIDLEALDEDAHYESGLCELYWPLNNTEIYIENVTETTIYFNYSWLMRCDIANNAPHDSFSISIAFLNANSKEDKVQRNEIAFYTLPSEKVYRFNPMGMFEVPASVSADWMCVSSIKLSIAVVSNPQFETLSEFTTTLRIVREEQLILPMIFNYREELPQMLNDIGLLGTFVEIGVNTGAYASTSVLPNWLGNNYFGIDPWRMSNNVDEADYSYLNKSRDVAMKTAIASLSPFATRVNLWRMFSVNASLLFSDSSVDVVFIDALHQYRAVWKDMIAWWRVVKKGGLMCGHDYIMRFHTDGCLYTVKPAVREFARKYKLQILMSSDECWCVVKS